MQQVPHKHYTPHGKVELCYDELCTRVTTSQQNAAALGGLFALAMLATIAFAATQA